MQFVVRADCIVHFRRKYLKGLLSIPSDGRGARRPLGQSFHESVGPAALYQVSAANRRDILIRRAYEHARRCLPRHVLGFRRLKGGDGRSRGKRRGRLVKFWHIEGTCLIAITRNSWGRRATRTELFPISPSDRRDSITNSRGFVGHSTTTQNAAV